VLAILLLASIPTSFSAATTLQFNPGHSLHFQNETFTVDITISNVVNLNSVNIAVSFNKEVLSCTGLWGWNATDGIFAGNTVTEMPPDINNALGTVEATAGLDWGYSVSGSGKLCTIQFQVIDLGAAQLSFENVMKVARDGTYLLDVNGYTIPLTASLGIVEVVASNFHESVFDVTQGTEVFHVVMHTNSTVSGFSFSQTSKEMSFSVTGLSTTSGTDIVTIPKALLNSTLVVLRDDVAINNYFNDTKALPENETCCFAYFNYTHSTHNFKIRLTVLGDITGDRKDDARDVSLAASAFGSTPGSLRWNPLADIDKNHKIDAKDVSPIAKNYGRRLQL
jgi:hypothetical protein